ncbi:MAG: PilZ domain-containing protein [Gemmataceae bacterium]|nr:PilZ domain-containing protein [Gemmataceae bacterium]
MKRIVEEGVFPATIAIITAAAVRLVTDHPLPPGTRLAVDLPDVQGRLTGQMCRVTLTRSRPDKGDCTVDALFSRPLDAAELRGAQSRGTNWRTSCHLIRVRHEGPWLATVQNISHSGIGLISDRPFDAGTFLEVDLPSVRRKHLQPRLIRITHVKRQQDGPDWIIGGVFLRALTEEELQVLL